MEAWRNGADTLVKVDLHGGDSRQGWRRSWKDQMTEDERIEALKKAADESGLSIDLLHHLTQDLSRQAFLSVIGRASSMPSYMKSIDSPYLLRRAKAPSSDSR